MEIHASCRSSLRWNCNFCNHRWSLYLRNFLWYCDRGSKSRILKQSMLLLLVLPPMQPPLVLRQKQWLSPMLLLTMPHATSSGVSTYATSAGIATEAVRAGLALKQSLLVLPPTQHLLEFLLTQLFWNCDRSNLCWYCYLCCYLCNHCGHSDLCNHCGHSN